MKTEMSLIPEFEELYEKYVNDPVSLKLLKIEGIAPEQLDVGTASHDFFDRRLADITTDANSTLAENISPTTYKSYTNSGQMKLLG
jgi:hypothetical protein